MVRKMWCVTRYDKATNIVYDEDFFDTLEEAEQYKKENENDYYSVEIEEAYRKTTYIIYDGDGYEVEKHDTIVSAALALAELYITNGQDNLYDEYLPQYTISKEEEWV